MGKVAFLFAGQGAQHPGMCADLIASEPAAKAVFDAADAVRPGTTEQCLSATKEELAQTINTQPCVFAADLAAARARRARGGWPHRVAGFALGEEAALTFAGAYTDEQGFELVCRRAELMAEAAEKNPGAMRAVVKLDAETVERLAAEAGDECWPVNYNSPAQTVVAGTPEACERLDALVKEAGGRAMRVAVSGAFHSPFMAEAASGLAAYLADGPEPAEPSVPVLANRTAEPYPELAAERAELLASQVANTVQWVRTLERMAADGVDTFVEVGPGKTLTGLVGRTLDGVTALPCETLEQLEAVLAALSAKED